MTQKPSYEELERRIKDLEKEVAKLKAFEYDLQLYRKTIETMAEGVYLIRTSDSVIVYTNPKFENMFGYGPGELIGKHVSIVNAPMDKTPEETATEIIQSLKEEKSWSGKVKNIKKDGTTFWCSANVSTFDHNDFQEVWISVHNDITERKQAEEALQKANKELDLRVKERTKDLEIKTKKLEEVNTALRVLIEKRDEDKINLEKSILSNVNKLVLPYLHKVKKVVSDDIQKTYLEVIESNINEIISPFANKLSSKYINLTPAEMQVADFVKHGKRTKEIANFLNLSVKTIESHRESIRKKIGIKNKKTNLRSYLLSLQ